MIRQYLHGQAIGFFQFIREQGVMGLALGFILGTAVSKVVISFSNDIINPIIAFFPRLRWRHRAVCHWAGEGGELRCQCGGFRHNRLCRLSSL